MSVRAGARAAQPDLEQLHGAGPQRSKPGLVEPVVVVAHAVGRHLVGACAARRRGEGHAKLGSAAERREQPSLHEAGVRHARDRRHLVRVRVRARARVRVRARVRYGAWAWVWVRARVRRLGFSTGQP